MTPADAHFTIVEIESEGDYLGVVAAATPTVPHAICTNFTPLDPGVIGLEEARAKAKVLIDRGFFCQTEAYLGDNPNASPDALHQRATQLGWSSSQPVFGVHNASLSTYAPWMGWPGADYLGEYVI